MATGLQHRSRYCNRRGGGKRPGNTLQEWTSPVPDPDRVSRGQMQGKDDADRLSRTNSHNIRFLRQSARITGYGIQSFDNLTVDLARIHAIFKRAIGPQLQDDAGIGQHDGFAAIDASNRYFSLKTGGNIEDERLITDDMDPKGYLRKAAGTTYAHTEDNKVYYFEKYEDTIGRAR